MRRSATTNSSYFKTQKTPGPSKYTNGRQGSENPTHQNASTLSDTLEAHLDQAMKCMSYFEDGSKLAFACFDEDKNEIILEESYAHTPKDSESIIESFLAVCNPNLILINGKIASNPSLLSMLTKFPTPENTANNVQNVMNPNNSNSSTSTQKQPSTRSAPATIPYRLLKSGAYDLRNCRAIILNKLRILTLLKQQTHQNNHNRNDNIHDPFNSTNNHNHFTASSYHSLASLINFDSSTLLRAVGSLLSFLGSTIYRLEEGGTITINAIQQAHSTSYMKIDHSTLKSLHIFSTEYHPLMSLHTSNEKPKEGFSLFTLLDKTKSKMGRSCLRQWMLKPLLSISEIQKRLDGVELMLHPDCALSVGKLSHSLKKIGAVDKILTKFQKCNSAPMDFLVLTRTLSSAIDICSLLAGEVWQIASSISMNDTNHSDQDETNVYNFNAHEVFSDRAKAFLHQILEVCHVPVLRNLHERIVSTIDEEITADTKDAVCIQYGFNEELDNAKEAFESLDETLSAVGARVLKNYPELGQLKVIYLPQVGFLTSLDKRQHAHNVATNEFPDLPPTFTFVFLQDNDAFFKNPDMRQLDEEIGDLDAFIKDTEAMIVSELEEHILDCESELRNTFGALAELDCIISFATCAADLNFTRPELCANGNFIQIENGRHPLQELILDDEFIPNDIKTDDERRVNVVTGPNFSGKSCYIRQVGVLVYMAQIGSFLPCDRAKLSIVNQILARISSAETCAVPQSTFQIDLTEMAAILRKSNPASLILIDEFGKGTAPASGIAILTSALRNLAKIKCKVFCTTHFLEIFSLGLLRDNFDGVKALRMAVHIPASGDEDDDPVPLFKLENGIAESSAGLACAKMAGVDKKVIGRAKEILSALKTGNPVQPISPENNLNSFCQSNMKSVLKIFLMVDSWTNASSDELENLKKKVICM